MSLNQIRAMAQAEEEEIQVRLRTIMLPRDRQLLMGYSIVGIERRRLRRQLEAIGWGIGLTILAVAGSVFFAKRLTQPIHNLAFGMSRVANGNLEVRLKRQSRDEIGALIEDFNQMVTDLQENVMERWRMSHELDDVWRGEVSGSLMSLCGQHCSGDPGRHTE